MSRHRRPGNRAASAAAPRVRRLGDRLEPHRPPDPVLRQDPPLDRRPHRCATDPRCIRLIAQMSLGTGALAVIGGTVVDRRLPDAIHRGADCGAGLQPMSEIGVEALDRFRFGLLQRPVDRAGHRRSSTGGHDRRRRHRATGRDADQRGDRRAGSDGYPLGRLPGIDPGGRRRHRGGPAVLRRGADGASSAARFGTTCVYGQSSGVYDHYFNTFSYPTDLHLVVRAGRRDGRRHHAGAHLLRVHRLAAGRPESARPSAGRCARR